MRFSSDREFALYLWAGFVALLFLTMVGVLVAQVDFDAEGTYPFARVFWLIFLVLNTYLVFRGVYAVSLSTSKRLTDWNNRRWREREKREQQN